MDLRLLLILVQLIGTCLTNPNLDMNKRITEIFTTNNLQAIPLQQAVTSGPIPREHYHKNCGIGKECVPNDICLSGKVTRNGGALKEDSPESYSSDENDGQCRFLQTCCSIDDEINELIDETKPSCGYQTLNTGGSLDEKVQHDQAKSGEFPWMVGIFTEYKIFNMSANMYRCGGSLIAQDVILTAAHKIYMNSAKKLKVCAGNCGNNETSLKQYRRVREIIVHEDFNVTTLTNDIALLFLETPFEMTPNIRTICLPPEGLKFDLRNECYLTTWCSVLRNRQYQYILRKNKLSVIPSNQCRPKFNGREEYFELQSSDLCAGGNHHIGACTGVIGGSPLVCRLRNEPNRFFQAGIATINMGYRYKNTPGVYGSVPQLRPWIDEQLNSMTIKMTPR